ncbi:MAG: pantoate--beta-alanine ligase [Candidatus Methylomirabilales bacterium]
MEIIRDPRQMQERVTELRRQGARIGFVPTMGYLHEGHLTLFRTARRENPILAVSIFVNPTQFDRQEDLETYPVDLEGDRAKAEAEGVDLVFIPGQKSIYPQGYGTFVEVEGLTRRWEGEYRPGHFRGVATVVAKLFVIVKPHRAYFGQKDYQQARIVGRLARDLDMDIEVVVLPTVREPDGLALSSRNVNLTPEERRQAPKLYRALCWGADQVKAGEEDTGALVEGMRRMIQEGTSATIDYVALCDPDTLEPLEKVNGPAVALLAVRFSRARLIDNLVIGNH